MSILKKKIEYNPYLLKLIQPVGGVAFKDRAIVKGDGYEACIRVYEFKTTVGDFWLEPLINYDNVFTTIDVSTENKKEILNRLDKSLNEQLTRQVEAASNVDAINASTEVLKLRTLVEDISERNEVIKNVTIRYYVSAKTLEEVDVKVKNIIESLETKGFKAAVMLNEQEYEWKSLFDSPTNQRYYRNKRVGEPIPSIFLGGGYPFYHTSLMDKTGFPLGVTKTKGQVLFDLFTKDVYRKSFNALVLGVMGSGKSTLLKKLLKNVAIVGNTLRVLDITGEFKTLIQKYGGKVIALDGTDGIINILQVFATVIDENTNEVLEAQSYMNHKSKLSMIYRFISPTSSDKEVKEFEKLISLFYSKWGIKENKATTYKATEYPILENFLEYVKETLYEDIEKGIVRSTLSDTKRDRLESIELNIESMVRDYGLLFNGYTTIENFYDEQIVSFEIKNLAQFDRRVFNAQTFNVMTMLWNNALRQGLKAKKKFDRREVSFEDSLKYLLLIDEAHKFINSDNEMAVDYLISFEREARKYFAGVMFATQSIRDVVPDGTERHILNKIKTLFELTQYKFIMQQDNNAKETLKTIFEGQISESDIKSIPNFKTGECILSINGYKNIKFDIKISDEEELIFEGGA